MSHPRVFISYTYDSAEHKKWVQSLAQHVERQGADVWLDQEQLVPGQRWTDSLREAWERCDTAIVIFTGRERTSEYGRLELEVLERRAREKSIRLIPILRSGRWSDLPKEFQEWYGIDMTNDQEFLASFSSLRSTIFRKDDNQQLPEAAEDAQAARRIGRLRLQNIKLFQDIELDFRSDGSEPRAWSCILADNGCGKTSLLQAIALAAVGDTLATKLTDDPQSFVPAFDGRLHTAIEADFDRSPGDTLRTRLELPHGSHDWFGAGPDDGQLRSLRSRRQGGFFVAAYGAGRHLSRAGQVAVPADPVLARLRNLFDQEYRLLGLEFGDAFHDSSMRSVFLDVINRMLQLGTHGFDTLLPGVVSVGIADDAVPGAARGDIAVTLKIDDRQFQLGPALLSSGYQSILAWLGELAGHQLHDFGPKIDPSRMEGIVLIDELDQHLHPTWQRRVVPMLRNLFPRMQFVITTHSPLVLTGFAASEIVEIGFEGRRLVQKERPKPEPGMQSGSQLYSSYFGTPTAARPALAEKEREALSLIARKQVLSDGERERLSSLEEELAPFWQSPFSDPAIDTKGLTTGELQSLVDTLEKS